MSIWLGNQRLDGLAKDTVTYDNITNCITEIPQDIKLELNNGALTLKAGSKVYIPNGIGNFDELVIQNDLTTISTWGQQVQLGLFVKSDGSTMFIINMEERCSSGSTPPAATNLQMWYDTTNNLVKNYRSGSDTGDRYSLPIALVQKGDAVESSNISSIDQVFNGFGYIGSTVFVLPRVKGLIPNGRNADGSLKNTEFVVSNVQTHTQQHAQTAPHYIVLNANSIQEWDSLYWMGYNAEKNIVYNKNGSVTATIGEKLNVCICGVAEHIGTTKITSFTPKTAFHAVDYNDNEYIAHQPMPSNRTVEITPIPTSGNNVIAPADGYFAFTGQTTSATNLAYGITNTETRGLGTLIRINANGVVFRALTIVSKGQAAQLIYESALTNAHLFFIYANGSK